MLSHLEIRNAIDIFRMVGGEGAEPHLIAFGSVLSKITEAIHKSEVRIYPPKVTDQHQN